MQLLPSVANVLGYFGRVRVALLVALLAYAILALPDQTLELYIIYAQAVIAALAARTADLSVLASADFPLVIQFVLGIMCAGLLSIVMWVSTLRLLLVTREPERSPPPYPHFRHELTATLVSILPVLALIIGFQSAVTGLDEDGKEAVLLVAERYWLNVASSVLVGLLAFNALVYFTLLRRRMLGLVDALFSGRGLAVVSALLLVFSASIVLQPVAIPVLLGTLAIVSLFLSTLVYLLTAAAGFTARHKVPVVIPLLILAVVFAVQGWSDNHRVRHSFSNEAPPLLEEAFMAWFMARKDRDHFEQRGVPYPIYLVAAEGGGIYAAYHVASFMARMQDQCPGFAQHTFGISSVSGGSLGASVFSALASEKAGNEAWRPCAPEPKDGVFKSFVSNYFSRDLLSPLSASTMFPDFIQRFLPFAIHRLDRARALETAFEEAWESARRSEPGGIPTGYVNPFTAPLGNIWAPDRSSPALFLNATAVTSGARVTLSHIFFGATPTALHVNHSLKINCADDSVRHIELPISAAVSLSARFPWLTPAGWLEQPPFPVDAPAVCTDYGNRLYLADGGYFENSGLESVIELAQRLRRVIALHPDTFPKGAGSADIIVIKVLAADRFAKRWWSAADLSFSGPGDLATPLSVLLNTRQARTRAVDSRTAFDRWYFMSGPYAEEVPDRIGMQNPALGHLAAIRGYYRKMLDGTQFFLPLGWHLSATTRRIIDFATSPLDAMMTCMIRRDLDGEATGDWDARARRCLPKEVLEAGGG